MNLKGINFQITASLLVAAVLVSLLMGEIERNAEVERHEHEVHEQAELTVSLLGGLMLEYIIVEDIPVLETAMAEAIARNPQIIAIRLQSADGRPLVEVKSGEETRAPDELATYEHPILFEGMSFGIMQVDWSLREMQALTEDHVHSVQLQVFLTVAALTSLFLILAHLFAMRPVRRIHQRMTTRWRVWPRIFYPCRGISVTSFARLTPRWMCWKATCANATNGSVNWRRRAPPLM